ncbi:MULTISPECIES: serine/threonine-protein kinase [Streptomyces]|nr:MULTISPECIES: serine/threonine-protein kinase [Streptomyces]MCM3263704.1 protein kinase [Streptomyces thermoviolaceus]WTD47829.1 protein kinase [Streptomyces thermoviolaceus]GGV74727.1 serine/threonine protein kinase [Streptomyces thermoviolaceus subsp. apingens]GHA93817.1 serine/threonine protein kinase [Streptomyces thermoviolaceus subsp. thermoviolaceus]
MRGNVNQTQGLLLAGRYRLAESIGSGGMGRVWRAHDEVLHREVAIKELTAALYVSESDQAVLLARTRAEARAAARINHSAVVTVHDVLEHDNRPWIVMELVEGRSLADAIKDQGRVEPAEAARVGLWVLRALRAAHRAGVLHRDVKPANVLLARDGRVLLTDFGIAQIEGDSTITRTGEVVGSVDYLAPERVRGHDPGPASDLWALGATLYTAVEGLSPFRRTSPLTTMQAVVDEEPAEPRHAGPLGPVITALLRKDPTARPDAATAERMLAEAAEGRSPGEPRASVPARPTGTEPAPAPHSGAAPAGGETFPYDGPTRPDATGRRFVSGTTPYHPEPVPSGTAVPGRRRRRHVVLALVLAALLGGGTAVAVLKWQDGRDGTPGTAATSPSGASSASGTAATPGGDATSDLPAGWVRRHDPFGFSIAVPGENWQRVVSDPDLRQVDYTPDGGRHFIRIAVDDSPDFPTPHDHQLDLEEQLHRLVDYQRITLKANTFRDRPGSRWEYTWTSLPKDGFAGPRRAVEEMYYSRDNVEYAIYMSGPADDWTVTEQQFQQVLMSWQPDGN